MNRLGCKDVPKKKAEHAKVAQMEERYVANVEVGSSNLLFCSNRIWQRGRAVIQSSAKARTPVQIRSLPHKDL